MPGGPQVVRTGLGMNSERESLEKKRIHREYRDVREEGQVISG